MAHPLDGARLKVVRAQEHLDALKGELRTYMDTDPYEIPIQVEDNLARVGSVRIKSGPPLRLSVIVGDCISNVRASLEYVAWQLATCNSPHALTDKEERRISFPIIDKGHAALVSTQAWQQLLACSVPTLALDIIEAAQPYHAGNDPVRWLSILANEDKHRLPLFTIAQIKSGYERKVGKLVAGKYTQLARLWGHGDIDVIDGGFKAPGPGTPADPAVKVYVDSKPTVFVSFQNVAMPREPVERTLDQIVKFAVNVIPRFDPFV